MASKLALRKTSRKHPCVISVSSSIFAEVLQESAVETMNHGERHFSAGICSVPAARRVVEP